MDEATLNRLLRRSMAGFGVTRMLAARRARRAEAPAAIVMYHSISDGGHRFAISPRAFRGQVGFLRDHYPVVSLREIRDSLAAGDGRRRVAITFDDAYTDFLDNAYPVLLEMGVPCTVFVPTGYIGRRNDWDTGNGCPPVRVMDEAQLARVARSPLVELGSHSVDHRSMRSLPAPEMRRQAAESKRALETLLGRPVTTFAYPYGQIEDFSRDTARSLAEAGYDIAVTTRWGSTNSAEKALSLRRISFAEHDGPDEMRAKVEGLDDWRAGRERLGYVLRRLGVRGGTRRN
jgi:peptidoglycan/xylan/chitin deacetylase (PgdA/CDA1 family)